MKAILAYMMAPISPSNGRSVAENLATTKAWLHFLRTPPEYLGAAVEEGAFA